MKYLECFFRSALNVADKKGTENQQIDMGRVVAETSRYMGELDDFFTGTRKRNDHLHHKIPNLTSAVIDGIKAITGMRSQIEGK